MQLLQTNPALSIATAIYTQLSPLSSTYGHRSKNTRRPVRSALFKLRTGRLVVTWVTSSESLLLYVFAWHTTAISLGKGAGRFRFLPELDTYLSGKPPGIFLNSEMHEPDREVLANLRANP